MRSPFIKWSGIGLGCLVVIFFVFQVIVHTLAANKDRRAGDEQLRTAMERAAREKYSQPAQTATQPAVIVASPSPVGEASPAAKKVEAVAPVQTANNSEKTEKPAAKEAAKPANCNTSLQSFADTIERSIPSWAQLDCHIAAVQRLSIPGFAKRAITYYDAYTNIRSGLAKTYVDLWQSFPNTYSVNVSSATSAGMPPYTSGALTNDQLDQKIRAAAVPYLIEKKNGRAILFHIDYPPGGASPTFSNADEVHNWMNTVYLPQKTAEAQAAEKLKAEYYVPFPVEADHFFGKFSQPTLAANLSEDARVALAQEFIDRTREVTRPYYTGRLTIQLGNNYDAEGEYWNKLNLKGWDEVGYTLLPTCDVATSKSYTEKQVKNYVAMAQAANIAWSIQELSLYPKYYKACDKDLHAIEADVYKTIFDVVDSQSYKPDGMFIEITDPSDAGKQAIIDYFKGH